MTGDTVQAVRAWQVLLQDRIIIDKDQIRSLYGSTTLGGATRHILAVLSAANLDEVLSIVAIAKKHLTPLYPISIGNNWGYGSASPVVDGCAILDLSRMSKILSFDRELGLVTVEPGVTPLQLRQFLLREQAPFLSPVFGSGPRSSLIGNALDRGHSLTPFTDRFGSVHALEAVLADGSIYRSANGSSAQESFFKWGIGPYLDGLFSQSNLGIVVNMTFMLAPRPDRVETFMVSLDEHAHFGNCIDALRRLSTELGGIMPSVRIYNPQRAFFEVVPYPSAENLKSGLCSESFIQTTLASLGLTHWTIVGSLYGSGGLVRVVRKTIRRTLSPYAKEILFYDEQTPSWLTWITSRPSFSRYLASHKRRLAILQSFFWNTSGGQGQGLPTRPPLWRLRRAHLSPSETLATVDYDNEPNCGFMFFSAVFPFIGRHVAPFALQAEEICRNHGIEPIIAFFNFSPTSVVSTVYLLFDKEDAQEVEKANECYDALATRAREHQGYLQRVPIHKMAAVMGSNDPFWQVARRIKEALDPQHVIAPGRYGRP